MLGLDYPENQKEIDSYFPTALCIFSVIALTSIALSQLIFDNITITPLPEMASAVLLFACCMLLTGVFDRYAREHIISALVRISLGLILVCVIITLLAQVRQGAPNFFTSYASYFQLAGIAIILRSIEYLIFSETFSNKHPCVSSRHKKTVIVLIGDEQQYKEFLPKMELLAASGMLPNTDSSFIRVTETSKEDLRNCLDALGAIYTLKDVILLSSNDSQHWLNLPVDSLLELKLSGAKINTEESYLALAQ